MPEPHPLPDSSAAAQRLVAALVHEAGAAGHGGRRRGLSAVRKAWLTRADPTVELAVAGTPLLMPLSHQLPVHQAAHPDYSLNLGRLAAHVAARRPDATIVDIGANIGDSVAIIRAACAAPILCIEGDEQFLPYLQANARRFADVEIAPTYVRTAPASGAGADTDPGTALNVVREGGTARLEAGPAAGATGALPVSALADVLAAHPRFAEPALVKVDTDGQDTGILADADDVLARSHPTVFFEFDPAMTRQATGGDALAVFDQLATLGYRRALFFTNLGEVVVGLDVASWGEVATLSEYPWAGEAVAYFDVCAFGPHDAELAAEVEAAERDRRRSRRGQPRAAR